MQFKPAKIKDLIQQRKNIPSKTNEICKRICLEYEVQNKGDLAKNWEMIYRKLVSFKRLKGQLVKWMMIGFNGPSASLGRQVS